jgi:glycerol-3-phosphate O-acyltransferase / dihydroxyacetone phosphate acyltransferase
MFPGLRDAQSPDPLRDRAGSRGPPTRRRPGGSARPDERAPRGSPLTAGMGYRLVRVVIQVLLWLFYRRIDVVGRERIPLRGPLIVAANHHNSVIDAMLIVATFPRQVMVLANAPLFRHPLIGPFLRLMRAVPVNRRLEAGDDPRKNEALFAAAIHALRSGGTILIFPEGRTQARPTLLQLRTGAARMLLGAESSPDGRCGVALLPVGLVFNDPGAFRGGSVLVMIGDPVPTEDYLTAYRNGAEAPVGGLTERLATAIRRQIVEAEDQYTLELLGVLERAWREEQAHPAGDDARAAVAWKQEVMRAARYLSEREPARVAEMRRRVELYGVHLDEVGLTSDQLGRAYTPGLVLRYVLENALALALGLPLAACGILCHAAPYTLTGLAVRWLDRTEEEAATDKIAAGLVLYPLFWVIEGGLLWWAAGGRGLEVFAVLLAPAGLLALAWRARLTRVGHQARAFVRFLADRDLHRRLLAERRTLVEELTALAGLVPDAVRQSRSERER